MSAEVDQEAHVAIPAKQDAQVVIDAEGPVAGFAITPVILPREGPVRGRIRLICPNCSTENVAGAKFCMNCGNTLNAGCPNCGFVNPPSARFCSDCGRSLIVTATTQPGSTTPIAQATPQPATPVAERRLVSVLFADLVGFTPFAEERDSEDVRETLSRYFDIASDVIVRYGGTVEKFIGDAVMAVWGAPTAHEDDAERAVRAALELVEAVTVLGEGIQARAGVLTGEAAVTLGATNQGLVAGDIVNTAARLQSVAVPGTVLVGEQTQLAASAAIAFERADDQALKGKTSPVPAWRALRVVAERGGRGRADTLEAPFVGRTEELRFMKDLFHATGREKRVRVLSIIGPAGIGKSRLAWEFNKYIDGVVELALWHSGRSPAYGEGISFWALGEMVRERCKLRERDDEATTRERVAATVAEFVHDPSEREWIERALLTLLGVESGMAADQLFPAWRTFFERISEQGTVVLIFEDMHFADTGLLDFVDHLLEWSRGLPIYVVTLARPDLIERRPNWGAGQRNFASLYLEPLSDADMRTLLAGLVPGLPESAVASIVERADGIPLYAVETVRTLVAEGKLVNEDGVFVPQGNLGTLAVPATLTALISARLDALDETDRRIVQDAAVLGQSFSTAALAAVAESTSSELETRLAGLVRRELLQRMSDARSPEQGQYEFVQALIREVAYNTLSKHDRKRLHLAAARYFESLGSAEIAGALASHYLAAHANAAEGAESDALATQARIALKAAAQRATSLGSFGQAITFYEQTLSVTSDPAEQIELLLKSADASRLIGEFDDAERALNKSIETAQAIGDREGVARSIAALGQLLGLAFRGGEAMTLLEAAVVEYADVNEVVRAELSLGLARARMSNEDAHGAIELLEPVLEIAERRGLVDMVAWAFLARANALGIMGRRRESTYMNQAARDYSASIGLTNVQVRAIGNLAIVQADFDMKAALDGFYDSIEVSRKAGIREMMLTGIGNMGYQAFLSAEWDRAVELMQEALAEDPADRIRLIILNNLIIIRAARGEDVAADMAEMERMGSAMSGVEFQLFLADPQANIALVSGDVKTAGRLFTTVGDADLSQGPEYFYRAARAALWDGDLATLRELIERQENVGGVGPAHAARQATARAGVAALEGRTAEALSLYRDALRGWRDVHGVWDEAMTGLDMAKLLDPANAEVAAAMATTREILERLDAKPYLAMLDAAAARAPAPGRRAPTEAAERTGVTQPAS